jgi:hypothetical protein
MTVSKWLRAWQEAVQVIANDIYQIKVRAARSRNRGAGGTLEDVASDRAGC